MLGVEALSLWLPGLTGVGGDETAIVECNASFSYPLEILFRETRFGSQ